MDENIKKEQKRAKQREYYHKNKEKNKLIKRIRDKQYREKNKEKESQRKKIFNSSPEGKAYWKQYREKNKEKIQEINQTWLEKNKEKQKEYRKQYREKNKDKINKWHRERRDVLNVKLARNLRNRIRKVITVNSKSSKTLELLGCSIEELKQHLESKFQSGMTWENYGYYGWHIDHIIPCCKFDLSKEEEQRKCFHYSNLQPLWWKDNLSKGDKI